MAFASTSTARPRRGRAAALLGAGVRSAAKQAAGVVAQATLPQCDYSRALFLFGHMRCGSTALANVLCSRPEISGYGEAHIAYRDRAALGRLAVNQHLRSAYRPKARYLFDKVLHSRYDAAADPALFQARAVFLVRAPAPAIHSIRTLFARIGSAEYPTDAAAAAYYEERLEQLARLWAAFPSDRRLGISFEGLTAAPCAFLALLSAMLGLDPPLQNQYEPRVLRTAHGAGDPLSSHRFASIVPAAHSTSLERNVPALDVPAGQLSRLERLYEHLRNLFAG